MIEGFMNEFTLFAIQVTEKHTEENVRKIQSHWIQTIDKKCVNWNESSVKTSAVNQREAKIIVLVGSFYCWNSFCTLACNTLYKNIPWQIEYKLLCTFVEHSDRHKVQCTESAVHQNQVVAWHAPARHGILFFFVFFPFIFFPFLLNFYNRISFCWIVCIIARFFVVWKE